jgi:ketosteroid isomerase-like protein
MSNCDPAKDALPTVYEAFSDSIVRQDSSELATFYTADSKVVPPGGDIVSGIDAIPGYFDAFFELGVKRCSFEILDIDQHGDIAIEIGRVTLFAEGDVEAGALKYLVVWKCENGKWLVHRDILTNDQPAS